MATLGGPAFGMWLQDGAPGWPIVLLLVLGLVGMFVNDLVKGRLK